MFSKGGDIMVGKVLEIVDKLGRKEDKLIEILIELQNQSVYNYLSKDVIKEVAKLLDISETKVYGIANFYSMLSTQKRGKHVIQICNSAPCYIKEGQHLVTIFEDILGVQIGEVTEDKMFSLEYTSCIGACDQAPAARIDEMIYGELDRSKVFNILATLRREETDE